jgi:Xaa-Pro aminopeptidase
VIEEAGYGEQFGHGTGHGVGIEVHEDPRVSPKAAEDDRLEPGAVFTVEPGIYVPGLCGVRIEDIVVMEEGGPRILTPNPKELLCL